MSWDDELDERVLAEFDVRGLTRSAPGHLGRNGRGLLWRDGRWREVETVTPHRQYL